MVKSIFRKNKSNITAGDEKCKTCGKCCGLGVKFHYIQLFEYDFVGAEVESGLRYLMDEDVLFLALYNANIDGTGGYFEVKMLIADGCHFLGEDGCLLEPTARPIVCCMFGPQRLKKDGTSRKRIECSARIDGWLRSIIDTKYDGEFWRFESWFTHNELLHEIFNELPANRKIEMSRSSWCERIVKPYDSVGVIFERVD